MTWGYIEEEVRDVTPAAIAEGVVPFVAVELGLVECVECGRLIVVACSDRCRECEEVLSVELGGRA